MASPVLEFAKVEITGNNYPREVAILLTELTPFVYKFEAKRNPNFTKTEMELQVRAQLDAILAPLMTSSEDQPDQKTRIEKYAKIDYIRNKLKLTPFDLKSLLNRGLRRLSTGSRLGQDQVDAAALQRLRAKANLKSMDPDAIYWAAKSGGSAGPKKGGVMEPVREVKNYVPTVPQVSKVEKTETPCMIERKVTNGSKGYWQWLCERTVSNPGTKTCSLNRVEDSRTTVVPVNCLQEYVSVLKGFEVDRTVSRDKDTGEIMIEQKLTPDVDRYGSTSVSNKTGREIPFKALQKSTSKDKASTPKFATSGFSKSDSLSSRALGGKANRQGGAEAIGSGPTLPDQREVSKREFNLTEQDLQDIELRLPAGIMQRPEAWEVLPALGEDDRIAFYAMEPYGATRNKARQEGFRFSFRYAPFGAMQQEKYLEWLVSVHYRLRAEHPAYYFYKFDPIFSTIATLESYILTALGRLEANREYFSRSKLFQHGEPHRAVMHKYLRVYSFTADTETWFSPLSARYLEVPDTGEPGSRVNENTTLSNLTKLYAAVGEQSKKAFLNDEEVRIPVKFQESKKFGKNEEKKFSDEKVVGIMEDELMSLLARLQLLGYAINTNADVFNAADDLILSKSRKYLTSETNKYMDSFFFDTKTATFHRLPALRMKQAEAAGMVIPGSPLDEFEQTSWQPVTAASFPKKVMSKRR